MYCMTNAGGGGGGSSAWAYIGVTYPAGSVCTATNGSTTLNAQGTSGAYVFHVPQPSSTPETWTVSCTDGTKNRSTTVSITYQYQVEIVTLTYSRLPAGYQEVEYVKCVRIISPSSYSYFRTGYNLTASNMVNTEINFAYMLNAPSSSNPSTSGQYAYIFGTTQYGLTAHSSTDGTLDYKFAGNVVGNVPIEVDVKHTIQFNKYSTRQIIDNGSVIGTCGTPSSSVSNPMILGSVLSGTSTSSSPFSIRLYEYIVKVSGTIVYDLVPCRSTTGSDIGFYDIIGGSFLSKSGGTVEAGQDV